MSNSYRAWLPEKFETHQEAVDRRDKLVATLAKGTAEDKALAKELKRCKKKKRCLSEACHICMRHYRIWLLRDGLMVLEGRKYWYACTIIPAGLRVPRGELASFDLKKHIEAVKKRLGRSPGLKDALVIGGVDFSLNTEDNDNPTWQPHLYLLIAGLPKKRMKAAVTEAFKGELTSSRPCRLTRVYGPRGALSYAYKALFWRRSGYGDIGSANTRNQPLKAPEQRELALFLDQYRVGDRLILRGMRRDGGRLRLLPGRRDWKAGNKKTQQNPKGNAQTRSLGGTW